MKKTTPKEAEKSRPHDAKVFSAAAAMLNMTATGSAKTFKVTRQTLAKWMQGETSAPREAYILLLERVMDAAAKGKANYAAAEIAKQKAADQEKKVAEKREKKRLANEAHIKDAMTRMKHTKAAEPPKG